jgi:hypothetical protein
MIKHSFLHVTVQHYEEEKPGHKVHECVSVNLSVLGVEAVKQDGGRK